MRHGKTGGNFAGSGSPLPEIITIIIRLNPVKPFDGAYYFQNIATS